MLFVYVGGGARSMALSVGLFLLTAVLPNLFGGGWSGGIVNDQSQAPTLNSGYSHGYSGTSNSRTRSASRPRRHSAAAKGRQNGPSGIVFFIFVVTFVGLPLVWQQLLQRVPRFAEHRSVRWLHSHVAAIRRQLEALFDSLQEHIHGQATGQQRRDRAPEGDVQSLPIELFASEEDLHRWSVVQLKEELRRLQRVADMTMGFSGGSESRETHRLLTKGVAVEKSELVSAVVTARGGESGLSCTICLASYETNEKLRVLRCGHRFHCECVDKWLVQQSRTCPLCGKRV